MPLTPGARGEGRGDAVLDPAVGAWFLCDGQAVFSLLDVRVLPGGQARAWELSEGEVLS